MINKLYEILEQAPKDPVDCELIGGYSLAEYLYSKGVRYITPAYYVDSDEDWYCSHCNTHFDYADYRFCPHCGAQFLAGVVIDKKAFNKLLSSTNYALLKYYGGKWWRRDKKKKYKIKIRV